MAERTRGGRRRLAVRVHLWGGLLAAAPLLVLGLSGAVLVFRGEIEDLVHGPPGAAVRADTPPRSLDAIAGAALLAQPNAVLRAVRLPARADEPYRLELAVAGRRLDVAVDPYTLRVVASRAPERSALAAVHALHAGFHAGRAGAVVVGLIGVWLTVVSVSGLWLYGPFGRRRPPGRALHRWLGGFTFALGIVVGVTGAALALAGVFASAATPAALPGGALARLDRVAERVEQALPGRRISALAAEAGDRVRVETRSASGDRLASVLVDRASGAIVGIDADASRVGLWDALRRLHAGDFGGGASRVVYATAGIALAVLSVTGFLLWSRRRA